MSQDRWSHGAEEDISFRAFREPPIDEVAPELALVREAGLEPLEIEALVPALPALASLGVVRRRTRVGTALGTATAMAQVVREAALRLDDDPDHPGPSEQPSPVALAQMLFRVHYATRMLSAAEARAKTQEASGDGDRQYRAHRLAEPNHHRRCRARTRCSGCGDGDRDRGRGR